MVFDIGKLRCDRKKSDLTSTKLTVRYNANRGRNEKFVVTVLQSVVVIKPMVSEHLVSVAPQISHYTNKILRIRITKTEKHQMGYMYHRLKN